MATGTQIVGEAKRKLKRKSLRPEIVYKMRKNKAGTLIRGPGTAGGAGGAGGAANMRPEKLLQQTKQQKTKALKHLQALLKQKNLQTKRKLHLAKKRLAKQTLKKLKRKLQKHQRVMWLYVQ